jgi:transcriptional regulator with XRE-family HTH domain
MEQVRSDIDLHLGRRLRQRRRLLGLTMKQLANACGVRFQQIQKYECAANGMSAARLWRLCQALDVPVGYFYDGLAGMERTPSQSVSDVGVLASRESLDLIKAYYRLAEQPRQRLLALAVSMNGDHGAD